MATLNHLLIRGVRSFGESEQSRINFTDRLTVILGLNGTGKTTILESLRFAITGCMPPSTRNGRFFINDPGLRGGSKTTASVELLLTMKPSNASVKIQRYS